MYVYIMYSSWYLFRFLSIFLCKHLLINFFIPLRWVEANTWDKFVLGKRDSGCTKERSRLAGMKLFTCNR